MTFRVSKPIACTKAFNWRKWDWARPLRRVSSMSYLKSLFLILVWRNERPLVKSWRGIRAWSAWPSQIYHFHIDHNAPCLTPPLQILHEHCFQFSWVLQIEDNGYAKILGVNKVHYGLCENGELRAWSWAISSTKQEKRYAGLLKMAFILAAEKKTI